MPVFASRYTRSATVAIFAAVLGCSAVSNAQDAPSTQTTPTNTSPGAAEHGSTQTDSNVSKADKKAQKKQKRASKGNTKGGKENGRVTTPRKDGQTDADAGRPNPNDKVNNPD